MSAVPAATQQGPFALTQPLPPLLYVTPNYVYFNLKKLFNLMVKQTTNTLAVA